MVVDSEPMVVLLRAATDALAGAGKPLRERGWDATLTVDAAQPHDDHVYDVRLNIRIGYAMRIPNEARA